MEQSSYMSEEGDGYLMVCVEISDVPTEGLECDIDVYLEATNGTAGKWYYVCMLVLVIAT